jgi:gluconolactonase
MHIKSLSSEFDKLINPVAAIDVIADGFVFSEGPLWDANQNTLFFSDIPANKIFSWSETHGVKVFRESSNFSNGLTFNSSHNLIACEHRSRSVSITTPSGEYQTLVSTYQGKKLNSPNDVIAAPDGSIIFTDPIYGLRAGNGGPAEQELAFEGVYRIKPDNHDLQLLTDSFERPNGLAMTADGKSVFIVDTVRQHIRVYSINQDWTLKGGEIWAELWDDQVPDRPDGIKFDIYGNLFSTGPGGVWVFN